MKRYTVVGCSRLSKGEEYSQVRRGTQTNYATRRERKWWPGSQNPCIEAAALRDVGEALSRPLPGTRDETREKCTSSSIGAKITHRVNLVQPYLRELPP